MKIVVVLLLWEYVLADWGAGAVGELADPFANRLAVSWIGGIPHSAGHIGRLEHHRCLRHPVHVASASVQRHIYTQLPTVDWFPAGSEHIRHSNERMQTSFPGPRPDCELHQLTWPANGYMTGLQDLASEPPTLCRRKRRRANTKGTAMEVRGDDDWEDGGGGMGVL